MHADQCEQDRASNTLESLHSSALSPAEKLHLQLWILRSKHLISEHNCSKLIHYRLELESKRELSNTHNDHSSFFLNALTNKHILLFLICLWTWCPILELISCFVKFLFPITKWNEEKQVFVSSLQNATNGSSCQYRTSLWETTWEIKHWTTMGSMKKDQTVCSFIQANTPSYYYILKSG